MLWCLFLSLTGVSDGAVLPPYNLSVSHLEPQTGLWLVQIQLEHEDGQPLNLLIEESAQDTIAKIFPLAGEVRLGATQKSCQPPRALGYHVVPEFGYYKVHDEDKSWKNAEEICRHEGTHLIIINSEFENQIVKSMINRQNLGHWIGIHDQYMEGHYVTVLNETLESTGWINWYPGQPEGKNHNCVWYYHETASRKSGIGDDMCTTERPFFCEKEFN